VDLSLFRAVFCDADDGFLHWLCPSVAQVSLKWKQQFSKLKEHVLNLCVLFEKKLLKHYYWVWSFSQGRWDCKQA
jgi:hypothetical protein